MDAKDRYTVQIVDVQPHLLAAARGYGQKPNLVPRLFELLDEVWKFLRANPQVKQEGLNVFLYHYHGGNGRNLVETDRGLPVEAGVIIPEPFESSGDVVCSATPAGTAATVAHIGPYEELGQAHSALRGWCQDNQRALAGPSWEVYGHWNEDPNKLHTDIFYLLQSS